MRISTYYLVSFVSNCSTGAVLAFYVMKRGYKVVGLYTEGTAALKNYMPDWVRDGGLAFDTIIEVKYLQMPSIMIVNALSYAYVKYGEEIRPEIRLPGGSQPCSVEWWESAAAFSAGILFIFLHTAAQTLSLAYGLLCAAQG